MKHKTRFFLAGGVLALSLSAPASVFAQTPIPAQDQSGDQYSVPLEQPQAQTQAPMTPEQTTPQQQSPQALAEQEEFERLSAGEITGEVLSLSGTNLAIKADGGGIYLVDLANPQIANASGNILSQTQVGDHVKVVGSITGNISAHALKNHSLKQRAFDSSFAVLAESILPNMDVFSTSFFDCPERQTMVLGRIVAQAPGQSDSDQKKQEDITVKGTITETQKNVIKVKTTDGKEYTVQLDKATLIKKNKTKIQQTGLKKGSTVTVKGKRDTGSMTITAERVTLQDAKPQQKTKK